MAEDEEDEDEEDDEDDHETKAPSHNKVSAKPASAASQGKHRHHGKTTEPLPPAVLKARLERAQKLLSKQPG